MKHYHGILAAASCAVLSSCYFNSAGRLVDSASYQAKVSTESVKQGKNVYYRGEKYYVEVARHRLEPESPLNLCAMANRDDEKFEPIPKGTQICEIPEDYGLYLTGLRDGPKPRDGYLQPVENGDEIKEKGTPLPVVRTAPLLEHTFNYNSPNKVWRYAAAPFAWLLVDLPVTCVENATIAGLFILLNSDDDDDDVEDDPAMTWMKFSKEQERKRRHR